MDEIALFKKLRLKTAKIFIAFLNLALNLLRLIFFPGKIKNPGNILIYRAGNIGDIVCAAPSFIAVRRAFPGAKITLLTSPGKKGMPGAKELLKNVWYLDELKVYYTEDINSWEKIANFTRHLRKNHYDLFIHLPDDCPRRLFRNLVFAKVLGVKSAFGFKTRMVRLFKKTQVDYLFYKTEAENLLDILKENNISVKEAEFDFGAGREEKNKIKNFLAEKWRILDGKQIIAAMHPGGKYEANQWPAECFNEVAKYLQNKYSAKIIITGGKDDVKKAEIIKTNLDDKNVFVASGKLKFLETFELLKCCSFLISNDTGAIHLAAAAGIPSIGLYGVRNIFGRWFPYGSRHKILYHKFLDCDYKLEECIKKSVAQITPKEVMRACDEIINENFICRRP